MEFTFNVDGVEEIVRSLQKMDAKTNRNTLTRTMRKSLKKTHESIRLEIGNRLHNMNARARAVYASQIGISIRPDGRDLKARIRPANKKVHTGNRKVNFAPLAHLFEAGVKPHVIRQPKLKRSIMHPGIPEQPIFAQTFDRNANDIDATFKKTIQTEIIKEFSRGK